MRWFHCSLFIHNAGELIELFVADIIEPIESALFIFIASIKNVCTVRRVNFSAPVGSGFAICPLKCKIF